MAVAALSFFSASVLALPSFGVEAPNLIVVGEDADQDSLPRHSRVVKAVLEQLGQQLHDAGFAVYDETAVTLGDFAQGRSRRTDAEVIDIARAVQAPPMDVAAIFTVYARAERLTYTTKITARIAGRLVDVRSGRRLGGAEVKSAEALRAPADCDEACVFEVVGRDARRLSRDLGVLLADQLAPSLGRASAEDGNGGGGAEGFSTAYSLVFDGFSPAEVSEIEEYLVVFSGYRHLRPVQSSRQVHSYWYETRSPKSRLNRNLGKMLLHLGIEGDVLFAGNSFTIAKRSKRENAGGSWDGW
ncbi:MAG: hypothetical protein QNJ30_06660 [Kiloniellales bacterium]|nr:hypothetical protein [Kiloniellales bacterium]